MDHINDYDKTYEKCEYCNNDANRAYKNRQYKTHFNKSFKSIEINN